MSKTILITGSTDGLGKEVARRLAVKGWKVLLHGRNPDKGAAVLAELREQTGNDSLASSMPTSPRLQMSGSWQGMYSPMSIGSISW